MTADDVVARWLEAQWAVPAEDRGVMVDGARIAWRGWGMDAVDRPGLVLVHGFRAHAHWWDHVAPSLAQTHRVAAIDLSGMGDSAHRDAYTRAQHGREILAVAADAGFDRVTLVAHSYGSMGAIVASIAAPARVRRLVIIDTALPAEGEGTNRVPISPTRLYPTRDAAIARFRLNPAGESPDPRIVAHIAHHSVRETPAGWRWKFDEAAGASLNAEADSYRATLFGVRVPTDVIHGERTEIMTPARRAMAREIAPSSGTPIMIPAAHHHIMIEQPIALVAALSAVLARD